MDNTSRSDVIIKHGIPTLPWPLLFGNLVSGIGDHVFLLALPWIVFDIFNSSLGMNSVRVAEFLGSVILGIYAGHLIDQYGSRKSVFFAIPIIIILTTLTVSFSPNNLILMSAFLLLSFLIAGVSRVFSIAWQSDLAYIYSKDELIRVNSSLAFLGNIVTLIGPGIAAYFILKLGPQKSVLINAISFIALGWPAVVITRRNKKETSKNTIQESYKEALKVLKGNRSFLSLTLMILILNIFNSSVNITNLFRMRSEFGFTANEIGIVLTSGAIGSLIISGLMMKFKLNLKNVRVMSFGWCFIAIGISTILLNLSSSIIYISLSIFFYMISVSLVNIVYPTIRQIVFPQDVLGKIIALTQSLMRFAIPAGLVFSGVLNDTVGSSLSLNISGIMLIFGGIYTVFFFKDRVNQKGDN